MVRTVLVALLTFGAVTACREVRAPTPAPAERPTRQFTQAQYEACIAYYADYAARRRNRYCNPAHDLGYFVDGTRQDTGGRIADGGPAT